ncbi:MAG: HisA/HisF-related TIM barrel protein [Gammaproteobacteria bacterium]
MKIIPVIDIKHQCAVQALGGRRHDYQPVNSPLCPHAGVADVVAAYLDYYRFSPIYIADLDALAGRDDNADRINRLLHSRPELTVWLDAGLHDYSRRLYAAFPGRVRIVLGTETGFDPATCQAWRQDFDCVLSLDYRDETLLGGLEFNTLKTLLTADLIVMSLHRIGARNGPDWPRLQQLQELTRGHRIYPAGGVRGRADLLALRQNGMAGALIASCLHDKSLRPQQIAELETT